VRIELNQMAFCEIPILSKSTRECIEKKCVCWQYMRQKGAVGFGFALLFVVFISVVILLLLKIVEAPRKQDHCL